MLKAENAQIEIYEKGEFESLLALAKGLFIETFEKKNTPENLKAYVDFSFSEQNFHAEFDDPGSLFFKVLVEGEAVGYVKLNTIRAQKFVPFSRSLEIERLYICERFKRRGIGTLVLEFTLEIARLYELSWIWLGVWEKNEPALRFYRSTGFETFDRHAVMMGSDQQFDLLMRKAVIPDVT